MAPLVPLLAQIPMRLAVLGSGDAGLAAHLHALAADHPDWLVFVEGYDEALSHPDVRPAGPVPDAGAGSSRAGLTQMQAMRYGAVPVVTAVGGLVDTVTDADLRHSGTSFVGRTDLERDLLAALFRAERRPARQRRRAAVQKRIMGIDWSSRASRP